MNVTTTAMIVTPMQSVQTEMDLTIALVMMDMQGMVSTAQVLIDIDNMAWGWSGSTMLAVY